MSKIYNFPGLSSDDIYVCNNDLISKIRPAQELAGLAAYYAPLCGLFCKVKETPLDLFFFMLLRNTRKRIDITRPWL